MHHPAAAEARQEVVREVEDLAEAEQKGGVLADHQHSWAAGLALVDVVVVALLVMR